MRPGFGPAAELPTSSPARRRHGGCRSPLAAAQLIAGNRRAAPASAHGTGRTAYTKDVSRTKERGLRQQLRECQFKGGCKSDEHEVGGIRLPEFYSPQMVDMNIGQLSELLL